MIEQIQNILNDPTKVFVIGGILEVTVRVIPTERNLSLIDAFKKIVDFIPNRRKNKNK